MARLFVYGLLVIAVIWITSHSAMRSIRLRIALRMVDRKLIYIEPSPETIVPTKRTHEDDRPDAIENTLDALIYLPRYETVREDLVRVLNWNNEVARLKRIIASVNLPEIAEDFESYRRTIAHRVYQRLRHSATVDAMTSRINEALRLDPASAQATALRGLIDAWRPADTAPEVLAKFLDTYDFDFLMRAAQYLRTRIRAEKGAKADARELAAIKRRIRQCKEDPLTHLKFELSENQKQELNGFAAQLANLGSSPGGRAIARRKLVDEALTKGWKDLLEWADGALKAHFATLLGIAPEVGARSVLTGLLERYGGIARFEIQDSIVFPITFGTQVGEFNEVDIMRISPQDVTPLEGLTDTSETARICGDKFGAFGAFLDKNWRKHDILRGRLDGAERLIAAVLQGDDPHIASLRNEFILEAQKEIALDWDGTYAHL